MRDDAYYDGIYQALVDFWQITLRAAFMKR
jgi:hypothetical protein